MDITELRAKTTVSIREAGRVLGLGETAAYRAARDGTMPTLRFGGRIVVPVPKLLALLGDTEDAAQV